MTPSFRLFLSLAASAVLAAAQTPSVQADRNQLAEPAVPANPLELVTGDAQPVQSVEQRAAVTNLLKKTYALSNVRAHPYHRKTSFIAFGSTSSDGAWDLDDIAPAGGGYRWTAQGPSYSVTNLYVSGTLYSNQQSDAVPLRLTQVRTAIFFVRPVVGPRATLRTATASLNGAPLTCVLLSHMGAAKGASGGRRWSESGYCIDDSSGALITYSAAPGLYVLYDYSQAVRFHDRLIPGKFVITEAGRTIVEAKTVSVSDATEDASLFDPAGLNQVGFGSLMSAPWIVRQRAPSPALPAGTTEIVALHAVQSSAGSVSGLEILASTNSALNQTALDMISRSAAEGRLPSDEVEPGASPQSHEIVILLSFTGAPQ